MNTSAKQVIENINKYNQLSVVFLILAIVLMIITVYLWHKLNIRNSIRVLTGLGAGRAVAKLKADTAKDGIHQTGTLDKVAPVITWSSLSGQIDYNEQPKDEVIQNPEIYVSINKSSASNFFIIEKDIVYTAVNL